MPFANKVPDWESISVRITAREALICHVEEWEVLLLLDDIAELTPLLLSRVDTSRVVRASVKEHDTTIRDLLQVLNHTLEVESDCILVVVAVLLHLQTGVLEDRRMVRPAGVWDVDGLVAGEETVEEGTSYPESARTGDGLSDGDAVLLDGT